MVKEQAKPDIAARLAEVRAKVADAAVQSGRSPGDVTIVGVTKGVPVDRIQAACELGLRDLGENRVQEWLTKVSRMGQGPRWHFIGTLQTNKVRYLGRGIKVLHSLDREALLAAVGRVWVRWAEAVAHGADDDGPRCLVQVNVSGEETKAGLAPDRVYDFVAPAVEAGLVRIDGLMTIAPYATDPGEIRWVFAALRDLRDRLERRLGVKLPHLSMGMSGDYEEAVREGATLVRIGTAIFGPRG